MNLAGKAAVFVANGVSSSARLLFIPLRSSFIAILSTAGISTEGRGQDVFGDDTTMTQLLRLGARSDE